MTSDTQVAVAPPAHPSLSGFIAWIKAQDPEATYNHNDICQCAIGQYLGSLGCGSVGVMTTEADYAVTETSKRFTWHYGRTRDNPVNFIAAGDEDYTVHTFGEAQARIEELKERFPDAELA